MGTIMSLRNIAIIAHVDHGKTTLVDGLLAQAGTFAAHEERTDRVMDSMDLERERGITILSKNTAVTYGDTKINIVDTPGHADFGGEVERVLMMVDGAMLLVDASEGPLPQTRFVLRKALAAGLKVMVCINKIDRPDARIQEVENEVYDLFIDLDADEEQLEFPMIYACAKDGYCGTDVDNIGKDLKPMFDAIIDFLPEPECDPEETLQVLVTQLGYDNYLGRLAIGRVVNGRLKTRQELLLVGEEKSKKIRVNKLFTWTGLQRVEQAEVDAGEIIAIAGVAELNIGDTVTEVENPKPLPRVTVDAPTIGMTFSANNSPFSGREGKYVTSRQIRERLEKEILHNVSIQLEETGSMDSIKVLGRGELQLGILIEQMRREGFELCVSKPEVVTREVDGKKHEPFEIAAMDFPDDFIGVVTEKMAQRKGRMLEMVQLGSGRVRMDFRIPSRGLIGFRGEYLNDTRGQGIMNTLFDEYDEWAGFIPFRLNGSLISDRKGTTTAYACFGLQPRGKLFVGNGVDVYEGMIIGESARSNDINVNITKAKQLTNFRSSGADEKLILAPPIQMPLEKALEYIDVDELVEITPENIRLRKRELAANLRSVVRGERKEKKK
jgi:GTP-binding protein